MLCARYGLFKTARKLQVRFLNLLEYQSKSLLEKHGVAVQKFVLAEKGKPFRGVEALAGDKWVIKAQILAGGRGKGRFENGLEGGVQIAKNEAELKGFLEKMLGNKLVTKQTPSGGIEVKSVMITDYENISKEAYVCFLLDRQKDGPILIASPKGGVDIEKVAKTAPRLMKYVQLDYEKELSEAMLGEIVSFIGFSKEAKEEGVKQLQNLWKCFKEVDATQIEINPFVETSNGGVIAIDAKLSFDPNAKFRQKEIFDCQDLSEEDPREVEAAKYDLNYIGMDGNIGCLVNGAGLAMATMDLIKLHGGEPANFLDCGGSVKEEQVRAAIKIITSDPKVKSVLVNIFGGIVNCATIANGLVSALQSIDVKIPLVVRLAGNNAEEARKIVKESGLNIIAAETFEEAAVKAVSSLKL